MGGGGQQLLWLRRLAAAAAAAPATRGRRAHPGLEHRTDTARGNVRLPASPAVPCSGQEGRAGYRVVWQS